MPLLLAVVGGDAGFAGPLAGLALVVAVAALVLALPVSRRLVTRARATA